MNALFGNDCGCFMEYSFEGNGSYILNNNWPKLTLSVHGYCFELSIMFLFNGIHYVLITVHKSSYILYDGMKPDWKRRCGNRHFIRSLLSNEKYKVVDCWYRLMKKGGLSMKCGFPQRITRSTVTTVDNAQFGIASPAGTNISRDVVKKNGSHKSLSSDSSDPDETHTSCDAIEEDESNNGHPVKALSEEFDSDDVDSSVDSDNNKSSGNMIQSNQKDDEMHKVNDDNKQTHDNDNLEGGKENARSTGLDDVIVVEDSPRDPTIDNFLCAGDIVRFYHHTRLIKASTVVDRIKEIKCVKNDTDDDRNYDVKITYVLTQWFYHENNAFFDGSITRLATRVGNKDKVCTISVACCTTTVLYVAV